MPAEVENVLLSSGSIGKRISNARKATGLTQAELSEKIGISEKYLSRVECGKQVPSIAVVAKTCEVLRLSADEVLSLPCGITPNDSIHNELNDFSTDEQKQILEIIKIIKEMKDRS